MACKWFLLLCGVGKKERGHTRVVSPGGTEGKCVLRLSEPNYTNQSVPF